MAAQETLDRIAWIASAAAFGTVSWHVAARAARDAIFLTEYDATLLPRMVIVASLVSVALVPLVSRTISALSPARFVPAAFGFSAVSMVGLSALYPGFPDVVAILLYLQIAAIGAVLMSGFWSVVNEAFDPRSAKLLVSRIGAAGSAGGLVGGFVAAQLAGRLPLASILLGLAGVHLVCAVLVSRIGGAVPDRAAVEEQPTTGTLGLSMLVSQPLLRNLALLVLGMTIGGELVAYVFKAAASEAYQGDELMRLFAWFYTGVAAGTLLLQSTATKNVIKALGLGRSVALQPAALGLGAMGAIAMPGLVGVAMAFAAGDMVRNSIARVSYELLYVPIDRDLKRRVKPLIDIGIGRLGDAAGGGLVLLLIGLGMASQPVLLAIVGVLALATFSLCLALDRGYVDALEQNLLAQAGSVDSLEGLVATDSEHLVLRTLGTMNLAEIDTSMSQILKTAAIKSPVVKIDTHLPAPGEPVIPRRPDPALDRIMALRSAALERVSKALMTPLDVEHVPHVIALLAWNEAAPFAAKALATAIPRNTGQLLDALLDPDQSFAVRRRIPACLVANGDQRAVDGLILGLADRRFEVKYRCGRALHKLRLRDPDLLIESERITDEVLAATKVSRPVWEGRSLLDPGDDETLSVAGKVLRERSNRSLDHVFTLLTLIMPPEPLRVAYQGLLTDDSALRGTALDYLENVLPPAVRSALWPYLEPEDHRISPVSAEDVVDRLLASHLSIQLNLAELKRQTKSGEDSSEE